MSQNVSPITGTEAAGTTAAPDGERIWSEVHDTPKSMTFAEMTPDAKLDWIDDQLGDSLSRIHEACCQSTDPEVHRAPEDMEMLRLMLRMVGKEEVEMAHHVNGLPERLGNHGCYMITWKPEITWEPEPGSERLLTAAESPTQPHTLEDGPALRPHKVGPFRSPVC